MPELNEEASALHCPACGYDLRVMTAERCPECGMAIDLASFQTSAIPWVHRRQIGRARAYLRTFWQITADSRQIRHEAAKPQSVADARAFARVTAGIVAVVVLSGFVAAVINDGGFKSLAVPLPDPWVMAITGTPGWLLDVILPWSGGATLWPVLPLCILMASLHLTTAPAWYFPSRKMSEASAKRAVALGMYAAAPLVLLLAAAIAFIPVIYMPIPFELIVVLAGVGGILFLAAMIGSSLRAAQWHARVHHAGVASAVVGVCKLLFCWLAGCVVLLFLIPWCVGFVRLILSTHH